MRRIAIIVGIAPLALCAVEAHAGVFTGLDGYWSFNGTAADLSGNGNTLTLHGDASFASGGQFGQALSLDGVQGSYAYQAINNTAFDFGSSDFTIQVWANFASKSGEQTLIEKFTGDAGPGWTFTTPSGVQFYANPLGGYNGNASFSTGSWAQFVVERSGNSLDIYYNNTLVESGSISGPISPSTNPLLIGARDAGDGRNFTVNGLIDDVGIWDRALSRDEISSLWNGGNGLEFGSPVPEPSTWAMMLLGFAGFGFAGYRQAKSRQAHWVV